MSLDTYTGLQEAVADWLNRTGSPEVAARTPDFIRLFEAKVDNYDPPIRHPKMIVRATALADSEYVRLPGDFLEMQRVRFIGGRHGALRFVTPEKFDDEKAQAFGRDYSGIFTVVGEEMQIYPFTAEQAVQMELTYYAKLPKLAALAAAEPAQPDNWLLREYPSAYLYGALLEAAPYLRDDERIAVWNAGLGQALDNLTNAGDRARHTAGTLKTRRRKLG